MKYAWLFIIGLCLSGCGGVKVATGVSPVADIANAGGKIEDTGQSIFQAVVAAHNASPTTVSQTIEDNVALAVNKLGHGGLTLNTALTAYNVAKAAGSDLTAQRAAVQTALVAVNDFLTSINKALPVGTLQTVDALVNTVLSIVAQVKVGVGL
jgi:hypothetical protein